MAGRRRDRNSYSLRVIPTNAAVNPGRQLVITLEGHNLNMLSALRVHQSGRDVRGFISTIDPPTPATQTRRRITVQAPSNAIPGNHQLALFVGRNIVGVPAGTGVSVVASKVLRGRIVR